jgi:small-conductance mechanosensitive channel
VRNYRRMQERRIAFTFGVTYDTAPEQLRAIPSLVRSAVEQQIADLPALRFDRAHFKAFGASSLDFEVVYYVPVPDYAAYMDAQQAINLALMEAFAERGIGFAFPTRTLHVETAPELRIARADERPEPGHTERLSPHPTTSD